MQTELPKLYSDSFSLCLELFRLGKNLSRYYRSVIGRRLEESSLELTISTRKLGFAGASEISKRAAFLNVAIDSLDEVRTCVDLALSLEILSPGKYGLIAESIDSIGNQLGGLKRSDDLRKPIGKSL